MTRGTEQIRKASMPQAEGRPIALLPEGPRGTAAARTGAAESGELKTIRVLLVEDNAGDARLLREMLHGHELGVFALTHLERLSDALGHLAKGGVDIVLLDLGLPDAQGLETLRRMHTASPNVPLVVLTGSIDKALGVQALQEGAQDYLVKGAIEDNVLQRELRYAVERHHLLAEAEQIRKGQLQAKDALQAHQLQLKDEFLSHVSHELRSPLTAIKQFTNIILSGVAGELTKDQREYELIVLKNVRQLQSMIDDLLEITRLQAGKLSLETQSVSIHDAIADTFNTLEQSAQAKAITLSLDCAPELPQVYADPTRLRQILIILFDNAIKFTPAGGSVMIRVQMPEESPGFLLAQVSDTGCGISPDMTERIFERLQQAPAASDGGRNGLGLGLYICRELVERQGGKIWVTSAPQQGSTFSVTLPVFSVARLIAPLLKNGKWPVDSVALAIVEVTQGKCSQNSWLSKDVREVWAREIRSVIQPCLLPDLDVLLPKMASGEEQELFFIVAFAKEQGAVALTRRMGEQLNQLERIRQEGLLVSVSYNLLEPTSVYVSGRSENLAASTAASIESLVKSETTARALHE